MDAAQLATYLSALDWPAQLPATPHPAVLSALQERHLSSLAYQSRDLHHHHSRPRPDLALGSLLADLPDRGGHCYQHSELLLGALSALGFTVARAGCWVLKGSEFKEGAPLTHNILLVSLEGETYLIDVGFASGSPRFPLKFSFAATEEVECAAGERYQLMVEGPRYRLSLWLNGAWFPLYCFPRDQAAGRPETITKEKTVQMFNELYTSTACIGIRDIYMLFSIQTLDSRLNFKAADCVYTLTVIRRGSKVEERTFSSEKEFLDCAATTCRIAL